MPIVIPPRKGLKAKALAQRRPDLSLREVAVLAGTEAGYVAKALLQERFGREKRKTRAPGA